MVIVSMPEAVTLAHANDYLAALEQAYVVANFEKRQATIQEQVKNWLMKSMRLQLCQQICLMK